MHSRRQAADSVGAGTWLSYVVADSNPPLGARVITLIAGTVDPTLLSTTALGDHPKAAIDDQVKSGHREKA